MRTAKLTHSAAKPIERIIFTIRGEKAILDADLAATYGVGTKELNRAVKRNVDRFPSDFLFQLTAEEVANLRCQIGTSSSGYGGRRYRPFAFTEQGANRLHTFGYGGQFMAANVSHLFPDCHSERSETAAGRLVYDGKSLASFDRLELHDKAILHLLRRMQDLLNPSPGQEPPKKEIGFHLRERQAPYRSSQTRSVPSQKSSP